MRNQPDRSGRSTSITVLLLAILVPVAAVLGGLYFASRYRAGDDELARINRDAMLHMTGLKSPTVNRLDPRFADLDGDLVADAPVDAAQYIAPATLTFSFVATQDPERYRDAWKPFVDHLAKVTGQPVEYLMFEDVKDQVKALRDGQLHVAGLNTGSVPTAVNVCGFVPIVILPSADGTGTGHMEIIVPRGSGIKSLADLRGRELTLTEPGSNSGYKAPLVLLRSDAQLDPGRDYSLRYSMGHDLSIDGIARKQFEVAAVSSDVLERAVRQNRIKPTDYESIYKSEKFPTAGLGYVHNLKPELAVKVREAMMSFDWKGTSLDSEISVEGQPTKFLPANYKNQWSLIRRIDDASGTVHEFK